MTLQNFKIFADLWEDGFRPYTGEVSASVYEELGCANPKKAWWIVNWPKLHCLGCKRRCVSANSEGFQEQLPERVIPKLTVPQLLELGRPLNVKEVSRCLNMSATEVYRLRERKDTALICLAEKPIRFTPESVKAEMYRTELD